MINCLQKEEETNMKKRRLMITAIILAMAIAGTGCGTKGSNTVSETKKETTVKEEDKKSEKDNSVAANTDKTQQSVTELSENGNGDQVTDTTAEDASDDTKANNSPQKSSKDSATGNNPTNNNGNNANNNRNNRNNNATTTTNTSGNNSNQATVNTANNTNTPAQTAPAQHQHTWQHVEATGHYETVTVQEAWDEEVPVYGNVEHSICNVCGADVTGNTTAHARAHALAYEGGGDHSEWRYEQTGTQTVHHDAVTEQHWVQDAPAYDVCTGCGATR